MIDPHPHIKKPAIPQICSQLPSLLPLKILLVIWPPLLISHIYFLLMIIILSMLWGKTRLTEAGIKYDTVVGNMVKNMLRKDKVLLLHMLWWRQEILLFSWDFQGKFRAKDLLLGTSMLYVTTFRLIVVFVSLPPFTLPVELFCACFLPVPLITPCIVFVECLNSFDDSPVR